MLAFDLIAEQRIREALKSGELDALPGRGKVLRLDDDALVPATLRAAYRVLSNAGVAPRAVHLRSRIAELERRILGCGDEARRRGARRRLALLHAQLEAERARLR